MKRFLISLTIIFMCYTQLQARVWYVKGTGDDRNDGLTEQTAKRTLQHVADQVCPGDVVMIGDGVYTSDEKEGVVRIQRSGTPKKWITWKAIEGQHPEVRPHQWCGIKVESSYHIIEGLRVIGRNDSIALKHAIADTKNEKPNPTFNTNGIHVEGRTCAADKKPHHVIIRKCEVGKCAGGGITMIECDYVTVEDCDVYDNAWYMRYAGSGITTLNLWAYDNKPGYHIIIQRNRVWNNRTMVPWEKIGKLSDGNGILLDVTNRDGQTTTNPDGDAIIEKKKPQQNAAHDDKPQRPVWNNRSLIANNLSVFNGGSGIHTFRTCHVDIVNNTTYWNGTGVDYEELFSNNSYDVVIKNNIIVPRPGGRVTSNNRNQDVHWDYNIYPVGQKVMCGPHDIVADPQFVSPYTDLRFADFHLKQGSLAIGSATNDLPQSTDIVGTKRPQGARDMGCYEQR